MNSCHDQQYLYRCFRIILWLGQKNRCVLHWASVDLNGCKPYTYQLADLCAQGALQLHLQKRHVGALRHHRVLELFDLLGHFFNRNVNRLFST